MAPPYQLVLLVKVDNSTSADAKSRTARAPPKQPEQLTELSWKCELLTSKVACDIAPAVPAVHCLTLLETLHDFINTVEVSLAVTTIGQSLLSTCGCSVQWRCLMIESTNSTLEFPCATMPPVSLPSSVALMNLTVPSNTHTIAQGTLVGPMLMLARCAPVMLRAGE